MLLVHDSLFYRVCDFLLFCNELYFCPLDMLFLQGSEVIFKVALSLLGSHKPLILQHDSLESIVDFIKTTLPNLGLVQMEKTINQVRPSQVVHLCVCVHVFVSDWFG